MSITQKLGQKTVCGWAQVEQTMGKSLSASIAEQCKNTPLGLVRIRKNLALTHLSDLETGEYLLKIIRETPQEAIERKGKNYSVHSVAHNALLTIHAGTLTIITAKKLKKNPACS